VTGSVTPELAWQGDAPRRRSRKNCDDPPLRRTECASGMVMTPKLRAPVSFQNASLP
jgi:hypothetical protein